MLKLVIFLIAELAAPLIIRAESVVFFKGFSTLLSANNPTTTVDCHPSSPYWTDTFLTQNISIQSIFKDVPSRVAISSASSIQAAFSSAPSIQTAVKIRFTCPKFAPFHSEEYVATDPRFPFSTSFVGFSASTPSPSWITIYSYPNAIYFVDRCTNYLIYLLLRDSTYYDIYVFAPTGVLSSASGLLAKGCPLAYTQTAAIPGYVPNVNVGRRKRQVEEKCKSVAEKYASTLQEYSSARETFSADSIYNICINSPIKDYATELETELEGLKKAYELYKKYFGSASDSAIKG